MYRPVSSQQAEYPPQCSSRVTLTIVMVSCVAIMTEILRLYRDATGQPGPGPVSLSAPRAVIYHISNKVTRCREKDRESGDDQRYTDLLSPEDVPTEGSEALHIVLDGGSGGEQLSTEERVRPRCRGETLSWRQLAGRQCLRSLRPV